MTFGEKVKHIRYDVLRMTQQELGESIGYSQGAINAIEVGKNKNGSFDLFRQLVVIHNVNPMFFLYEKANEPAILIREGKGLKPLLQKVAKYEKLIIELNKVKNGR